MFAKAIKGHKVIFVSIVVSLFAVIMSGGVFAKIPEPDNIIYGIARDDAVTIKLKVNGDQIAAYTMGDNPDAGSFYVLRVPMDALAPAEPGSAHTGDEASVFVNDETEPTASLNLGERGTIHRLDLNITDTDGDGLPDDLEQQIIDADPNDAISTLDDVLPGDDFDGDGESNWTEYANATDPTDPMSAQGGDVEGDKTIDLADAILALQVLSGVDTSNQSITTDADIDGDDRIGLEEVSYIMQKVSDVR